jgi:hypothetical protein
MTRLCVKNKWAHGQLGPKESAKGWDQSLGWKQMFCRVSAHMQLGHEMNSAPNEIQLLQQGNNWTTH